MDAAVSEFVIAGNAMARRAQYQFGIPLPRGERGNVDAGVGKFEERGPFSTPSIIAPTDSITQPIEIRTVDGVRFVFQLASASEAPAEMDFFLSHAKVLDVAENASHMLHNLLPLRRERSTLTVVSAISLVSYHYLVRSTRLACS
jgi:alkyl sulfatase BDS1-like metallo-beta-lactamase superfamily hydrolase